MSASQDSSEGNSEGSDVWRVSTRPSDGPAVAARFGNARSFYDWGGGLVWLAVEPGTNVRAQLSGSASGHATLFRASAQTRRALGAFEPESAPLAQLSEGLRREFDPAGVLNRGRMAITTAAAAT
jgi:glycolate oxidase FAD binding subunit